eukprot:1157871-Pleurochrysis_carterae.AAC.1
MRSKRWNFTYAHSQRAKHEIEKERDRERREGGREGKKGGKEENEKREREREREREEERERGEERGIGPLIRIPLAISLSLSFSYFALPTLAGCFPSTALCFASGTDQIFAIDSSHYVVLVAISRGLSFSPALSLFLPAPPLAAV